ncbi:voltage-gated chloride channel family protein [Psychroflexus maritimus]|uniref:Voltage-gated chloride channel family protein n=1 Tax=Psychroflexus maritimus TaxID=2714865 RepID=A0A967E1K5_9FLAO|nr:voltage-gated chloride channel family protein [Psychroflexus maritimus]NGZ88879.1 voltage-gated chloride channel family protein [Psychroflexus maritimus]
MKFSTLKKSIYTIEQFKLFHYLFKWTLISLIVGGLVGSATAIFLLALKAATNYREANLLIISLLPIGGLIIGFTYFWLGKGVEKGNNLLLEEYYQSKKRIPFKMAPLVLFGTVATHLFGGSAGREGTAVQIGGAIADQFTKLFRLHDNERKILLIMGMSAGFAAVFGTPLAGSVFALEVLIIGRIRYEAIFPSLIVAIIADYFCVEVWNVPHTVYVISEVAQMNLPNLGWTIVAGICFGLTAMLFSRLKVFWKSLFSKIKFAPLRPFIGGIFIAGFVFFAGTTKYIGLGIPIIEEAFHTQLTSYDFLIKVVLTAFTLGAGFKGGEVTPLFFMGATLGNALFLILPLPMSLLAGMGFVAVFAGATNTPLACIIMGIELFGIEAGLYIALACVTAYFFSGHTSVYTSQIIGSPKHNLFSYLKGKKISQRDDKS